MATRLHIVMPCCRPQNLPALVKCYLVDMEPHPFEVRWHILYQGPEADPKGCNKANEGIAMVRDGWLFTPSDDKLDFPPLFRRLGETIAANSNVGAVVFSQLRPPCEGSFVLHARPDQMTPGHVDGSQVFWRRDFLGENHYEFEKYGGYADGYLISNMHRDHPDRFAFVDETLTRFNSM